MSYQIPTIHQVGGDNGDIAQFIMSIKEIGFTEESFEQHQLYAQAALLAIPKPLKPWTEWRAPEIIIRESFDI